MSRDDDIRFCGLYNLVEVKATGRVGLYIGGVLSPPDKGGDWLEVRFEDGTYWRYRPEELKRPRGASRIFDTERYAFTRSAPASWRRASWRRAWEEWSAENAVGQLMSTLRMYAERQLEPPLEEAHSASREEIGLRSPQEVVDRDDQGGRARRDGDGRRGRRSEHAQDPDRDQAGFRLPAGVPGVGDDVDGFESHRSQAALGRCSQVCRDLGSAQQPDRAIDIDIENRSSRCCLMCMFFPLTSLMPCRASTSRWRVS